MTDKKDIKRIYDIQDLIKLYHEQQTFVFLKKILPSGREYFFVGFITKIHTEFIEFFDIKYKKEFPILIMSILDIEINNRQDINEEQAKKMLKEYRENNKY